MSDAAWLCRFCHSPHIEEHGIALLIHAGRAITDEQGLPEFEDDIEGSTEIVDESFDRRYFQCQECGQHTASLLDLVMPAFDEDYIAQRHAEEDPRAPLG